MYARGIRIGCMFLRMGRVKMGGGRRVDLVGGCFVRGHLGSLDGEILDILIDFLDDIPLIVRLDGIMRVAPVVFLGRGRRAGCSEVELETVCGEAGWVGGHVPGQSSAGRRGRAQQRRRRDRQDESCRSASVVKRREGRRKWKRRKALEEAVTKSALLANRPHLRLRGVAWSHASREHCPVIPGYIFQSMPVSPFYLTPPHSSCMRGHKYNSTVHADPFMFAASFQRPPEPGPRVHLETPRRPCRRSQPSRNPSCSSPRTLRKYMVYKDYQLSTGRLRGTRHREFDSFSGILT